ncbi:MAG: TM2 domain-containing protein [Halofilum sp. (in: g-proteobacteria)]|nr:TM2 domain-containing protein [Halofilum sp. (in: g-proteobacteria)]
MTEEERLRKAVRELPDDVRRAVHLDVNRNLCDPDTYAVLNWFFLLGIHRLYLRRWGRAAANIALFLGGLTAIAAGAPVVGGMMIAVVVLWEFWELFRSQIIVQAWNNGLTREVLRRHGCHDALARAGERPGSG